MGRTVIQYGNGTEPSICPNPDCTSMTEYGTSWVRVMLEFTSMIILFLLYPCTRSARVGFHFYNTVFRLGYYTLIIVGMRRVRYIMSGS